MAVQVNTTITRRNVDQLDRHGRVAGRPGHRHVVGVLPGAGGPRHRRGAHSPEEYELVFAQLWHHAQRQPYAVKTTEAPHYRRFVLQHGGDPLAGPGGGQGPSAAAIADRWASATARG